MAIKKFLFITEVLHFVICIHCAAATDSCHNQVYPRQYYYPRDSVTYSRNQYNCFNFTYSTYCNHPSKLTNSIIGEGPYDPWYFHEWNYLTGSIFFTFPKQVNLTHIVIHYYTDNYRGLPYLNILAEENGQPQSTVVYSVAPGMQSYGHKNKTISFAIRTNTVHMFKPRVYYFFSLSEVDFFAECDDIQKETNTGITVHSLTEYFKWNTLIIASIITILSELF